MSKRTSLDEPNGTTKLLPRRAFDLSTTPSTIPSTPNPEQQSFQETSPSLGVVDGSGTPARTRSILNLTSSTLFGIYRDTDYATEKEELSTPWGTGAQTPAGSRKSSQSLEMLRNSIPDAFARNARSAQVKRKGDVVTKRRQHAVKKGLKAYWLPLIGNNTALFIAGVLYGLLVSHLHDRDDVAPVKVEGINHSTWQYPVFWGFVGILLGRVLPYVDELWSERNDGQVNIRKPTTTEKYRGSGSRTDVVRSIGAFVGIAFAIRKVSWQSTIQLSLTLALVNPFLWYLIDRTAPGFLVSAAVAISGTALVLGINPGLIPQPSPAPHLPSHIKAHLGPQPTASPTDLPVLGLLTEESLGVTTWIASVLFVSCVCFGNIGRRLARS